MKKILYITYDGLTDPLGSSQILPYLVELSKKGHQIHIISCEKIERFDKNKEKIDAIVKKNNLTWHPLSYHKNPPILSTVFDAWNIYRLAQKLHAQYHFHATHCRSYISSLVGLSLLKKNKLPFIFDMRGFWADERVDGNLWNLKNPLYLLVYRYFKKKEMEFLRYSHHTISLTHLGKAEIERWVKKEKFQPKITVIPCCVDLQKFSWQTVKEEEQEALRKKYSWKKTDTLVVYLGSIGTWYLLEEMLDFFTCLQKNNPQAKLLFLTPDNPNVIRDKALARGIEEKSLTITMAAHHEVPQFLSLSNLGLFFIKPSYSKKSSSPTKLAEILGMGVPVIANSNVGDANWIFENFSIGLLIHAFTSQEYERIVAELPKLKDLSKQKIRSAAEEYFSLHDGAEKYHHIYESLP